MLDGSLQGARFRTDPHFGLAVPTEVAGVEPHILEPFKTWRDKDEFAATANKLVEMFRANFTRFEALAADDVRHAGPAPRIAVS